MEGMQGTLMFKSCRVHLRTLMPTPGLHRTPFKLQNNLPLQDADKGKRALEHNMPATISPSPFGTTMLKNSSLPHEVKCHTSEKYQVERVTFYEWILVVETTNPPKHNPLTVVCMPTRFVSPSSGRGRVSLYGLAGSRRIAEPCSQVRWRRKESPTKFQMFASVSSVCRLENVRRINFLPAAIVVELEHGDGRAYSPKSLPGTVVNRPTTYHHGAESLAQCETRHVNGY